jgi:hypothetical protein
MRRLLAFAPVILAVIVVVVAALPFRIGQTPMPTTRTGPDTSDLSMLRALPEPLLIPDPVADPIERVRRFLEDYDHWERTRPGPEAEPLLGDRLLHPDVADPRHGADGEGTMSATAGARALALRHGLAPDLVLRDGVIASSHSVHGPGETILGSTWANEDRVVVQTRAAPGALFEGRYDYALQRVDGDWRIESIRLRAEYAGEGGQER